jgi:hypothetical protein
VHFSGISLSNRVIVEQLIFTTDGKVFTAHHSYQIGDTIISIFQVNDRNIDSDIVV